MPTDDQTPQSDEPTLPDQQSAENHVFKDSEPESADVPKNVVQISSVTQAANDRAFAYREREQMSLMISGTITVVELIIIFAFSWVLYGRGLKNVPVWLFAGLEFVIVVAAIFQFVVVYKRTKRRRPSAASFRIKVRPDGLRVHPHTFDTLRFRLSTSTDEGVAREHEVLLVTRKHWAYAFSRSRVSVVGAVLIIGFSTFFSIIDLRPRPSAWFWIVLLVPCIIGMSIGWLRWLSWYMIITDQHVMLVLQYPAALWMTHDQSMEVDLKKLDLSKTRSQRGLGDLLGYGVVGGDTPAGEDKDLNRLDYMQDYVTIATMIIERRAA